MIDNELEQKREEPTPRPKRHTRPRGVPTVILHTPIHVETDAALRRVAKKYNVGFGEIVDQLVKSAEANL